MTLIELRRKANVTRERVCVSINVSMSTIQRWESGNTLPPSNIVPALASLYGVSVEDIHAAIEAASKKETA